MKVNEMSCSGKCVEITENIKINRRKERLIQGRMYSCGAAEAIKNMEASISNNKFKL
jgi:hypothetical protein